MTLDDIEKLARQHEDGHTPRGLYPECVRCHETMEVDFPDESCAFCATCMYAVADVLARAVIAMAPVARSARRWDLAEPDDNKPDSHDLHEAITTALVKLEAL